MENTKKGKNSKEAKETARLKDLHDLGPKMTDEQKIECEKLEQRASKRASTRKRERIKNDQIERNMIRANKKIEKGLNQWLKFVVWSVKSTLYTIGVSGIILIISLWSSFSFEKLGYGVVFSGTFGFFYFMGLVYVKESQKWIVNVFGAYYKTYDSGPHWLVPFLMTSDDWVSTKVRSWSLWPGAGIEVDFIDDSAIPKSSFVQVSPINAKGKKVKGKKVKGKKVKGKKVKGKKVKGYDDYAYYKIVYAVRDLEGEIVKMVQALSMAYLGTLELNEGAKANDLVRSMRAKDNTFSSRLATLEIKLASWGFRLDGIFVGEYDLSETTIAARAEKQQQKVKAEAAQYAAIEGAYKLMGVNVANVSVAMGRDPVEDPYQYKEEDALELADEYARQSASLEKGAFQHRKIEITGDSGNIIAGIVGGIQAIKAATNIDEEGSGQ